MLHAIFKEGLTFFVSNILQESITKTDIIASLSSAHSLTLLVLKVDKESQQEEIHGNLITLRLTDEDFFFKSKD